MDKKQLLQEYRSPSMILAIGTAVFALSGTAFAAATITSADIKNGTITNADIKAGTIKAKQINPNTLKSLQASGEPGQIGPTGPAGTPGATGAAGPQGPAGAKGDTGAQGATGATGAQGATGATGPKGDDGESYDPREVTDQTSLLFGFTPWYDSDAAAVVDFQNDGVHISTSAGLVGVNLPIARGTSVSAIKEISYKKTGAGVLAIELYYRGGLFENGSGGDPAEPAKAGRYRGDYTTVRVLDAAANSVSLTRSTPVVSTGAISTAGGTTLIAALEPTTWGDVLDAIATGGAGAYGAGGGAARNLNAALVLGASLRTNASASDATPSSAVYSEVGIQLTNAHSKVIYEFANSDPS